MSRVAVIMAGGTGGHIFPGLAVADGLRQRGWQLYWMGAPAGMEARLVPPHAIPMLWVDFGGVRGKGLGRLLRLPLQLARALWQAGSGLRRVRPQLVIGMGGYITVPGGLLARLCGARLMLHEQNAVAGVSNRLLARLADRTLNGFPGALPGGDWVGNPVRADILALPQPALRYRERSGPLRLLVVGGSLGAQALNTLVPQALALLPPEQRPRVLHQSGRGHLDALQTRYAELGVEADCRTFIDDMAAAYADADLVICRAGASTVSEVAACGVAALFVPFPHAVDDHQTANARFLADADAALLLQQSALTPGLLADLLGAQTRDSLAAMAARAHQQGRRDAVQTIVALADTWTGAAA